MKTSVKHFTLAAGP